MLKPLAQSVRVRFEDGEELELAHEAEGVWTAVRTDATRTMDYRLLVAWADGIEHLQDDPYRFAPTLGEVDLHLVNEGRHEQLWTVLGARLHEYDGPMGNVRGVSFAVWAPRAKAVRVIGDFNDWDGRIHPMRLIGASGVWELFVPDVGVGHVYKYEIRGADDVVRTKADPMARRTECPPNTGSVVDDSGHEWADTAWMDERAGRDPHDGPMSVYEVHLGSWRQGLSYRDLAEHLVNYVSDLGFTHVELLPVMEHPYGPSWGYQVTGYYAPTARFGTPDDFKYLVDALHQAGIGVILDWVPGHFPRDAFALARFDGLPLYEHPDPRRGDQPDWGTHVFDFGRLEVRNFLVANALYWLEEFHIDGLRVDAVASMLYLDYSRKDGEWIPNVHGGREHLEAIGLLQEANATAYKRVPGIVTIAEESTSWPGVTKATSGGGLGFGLKWNMGWMNDTLRYLKEEPIHRQYHHNLLTFSLMYAFSENYLLPISHDEVVHGKGSLLTKIPGHARGAARDAAGLPRLHVDATPASSCSSWAASSPSRASGPTAARSTGGCSTTPPTTGCTPWSRSSTGSTGAPRDVGARLPAGRLPLARRRRQHRQRAVLPALRAARPAGRRRRHGRQLQRRRQGVGARRCAPTGPLGGRARHQRVRRGQQPEPGRRRARGRGVAVARPAVVGHRAGRQALHPLPRPGRRLTGSMT